MGRIVQQKIHDLAGQAASECSYELVDLTLLGSGKRITLRVIIDKEGGVTLNDCEIFSRRIEALLDVEGSIAGPYTLEVSSPGLDRPLKKLEDFKKNIGKLVRIITREKINNQNFFAGRLKRVNGSTISLSVIDGKEDVVIPFESISKAKLEIELK